MASDALTVIEHDAEHARRALAALAKLQQRQPAEDRDAVAE